MRTDSTTLSSQARSRWHVSADQRALRRGVPARLRRAATTQQGARTRRRRTRRSARPGDAFRTPVERARRASNEDVNALRPRSGSAPGLPDDGRARRGVRVDGVAGGRRRRRLPGDAGQVIDFPGFLRAYVEVADEPARSADDRDELLPPMTEGDVVSRDGRSSPRSTTRAAGALHRGDARQGARGPRHRPPVDLRQRSSTPSCAAGTRSRRARPSCPRFSRSPWSSLLEQYFHALVDYEFHRADGGRSRRDRRGERVAPYLALLLRQRTGEPGLAPARAELGDIDAREVDPVPTPGNDVRARRPLRPVRPAREDRQTSRQTCPDELTSSGRGAPPAKEQGDELGHHPESRSADLRHARPLRPVRAEGHRRGTTTSRRVSLLAG